MDNAATSQLDPEVLEAMKPYFFEKYAVASTELGHTLGIEAREALESARESIARRLGLGEGKLIFTSGGTEANNLAIKGVALAYRGKGKHIVTTKIEHRSVLNSCKALERAGFEVTYVGVDRDGRVNLDELESSIRSDTILVSIQHANDEVGTLQDLKAISEICKSKGVLLHTDAAISFPLVDLPKVDIDLVTLTAHKIHGPKGVGALFIREGVKVERLIDGGYNEFELRAGTENVPGAVGFAKAVELATSESANYVHELRDYLEKLIFESIPEVLLNGSKEHRVPHILNVSYLYVEGESILLHLDMRGIAVTTGSACFSRALEPSYVLMAMGRKHEESHGSIRYSLSRFNTREEVEYVAQASAEIVAELRKISPLWREK